MWEFPKIWDTLLWGPYNKDPTIKGSIWGSPIFGNSRIRVQGSGFGASYAGSGPGVGYHPRNEDEYQCIFV